MRRSIYKKDSGGAWRWFDSDGDAEASVSPFVHDDTLKTPLRHMKTGELCDSKHRLERINRSHGLRCVGNDLESKAPDRRPEKITDAQILDKIDHALAIHKDPARQREWFNMQHERTEKAERLLAGKG